MSDRLGDDEIAFYRERLAALREGGASDVLVKNYRMARLLDELERQRKALEEIREVLDHGTEADRHEEKIDQSLKRTTGEEMATCHKEDTHGCNMPPTGEEETDRPTTRIEWRDAREEEPDEDTAILILDQGAISSATYYDQGQYEAIAVSGAEEIRWSEIEFWAPIPDDLPTKDWTLEVLNRQMPGWETIEKGEHYALETEIQRHNVSITAVRHGVKGAEVTIRIGPEVEIKNVQHGPDLTTSFQMALDEAIKEISIVRRNIEKVESELSAT